jgi:hypothetical protein
MMAKAHEPDTKRVRSLTPEEVARRKAALEGGEPATRIRPVSTQTSGHSGPVENYTARLERAAEAIPPSAIDYDRDGVADTIVGRGSRNVAQQARGATALDSNPATGLVSQRAGHRGNPYSLGVDGFSQNQMGYRDRLRARIDAAAQVADAEDETELDPRTRLMAKLDVPSHGSTGVPGGLPTDAVVSPPPADAALTVGMERRPTPTEQAIMAPQTPHTGFANRGALLTDKKPKPPGGGEGGGEEGGGEEGGGELPVSPPGNAGPFGTVRRSSYGSVPVQGTAQEDGSFVVGGPAQPPAPPEGRSKSIPAEHARPHEHAKSSEHARAAEHVRSAEHTARSAEHTAKSAEHTAKTAEHVAKAHEHPKPHEHTKHPEHHDKK